jgi:hypothetical protein
MNSSTHIIGIPSTAMMVVASAAADELLLLLIEIFPLGYKNDFFGITRL